ncbi:MAG: D-aminoacylase [Gemmatimonadota bacterium]
MHRNAAVLSALAVLSASLILSCTPSPTYDVVIRHGTVYDGSGGKPVQADVAIRGDSIVGIGDYSKAHARTEVDATGLAVAPGFINMLSWATQSLIQDGRGMGDIMQGVTLEVMGEGESMGPWNDAQKAFDVSQQGDIKYPVTWSTLGGYMDSLVSRGISTNVASFVGATTVRVHEIGSINRAPTPEELERMRGLVRQAMEEGALGVGSALIYTPATFASTEELIELSKVASSYGGSYISHIRNESSQLPQAIDELIRISREAGIHAEVYHFKAAGKENWGLIDTAIAQIERARASGLNVTADMYNYTASSTGLDAIMPPWVQEGGYDEWVKRLKDPAIRKRVAREIVTPTDAWDNGYISTGSPDKILLVGFKADSLKKYTGRTLADVAKIRGKSAPETAMDLVIGDGTRVQCVFFEMSEDNVKKEMALPWVSFASDGESMAPEGVFLLSNTHPRSYGNFARLLGKYVREEKVIPLEEAIRKLTSLPATNLGLKRRGMLKTGDFADVVVFDPATIIDHATFDKPHQLATGVRDLFVNGVQVVKDGTHTGSKPGRVVRGPGYKGR